MLLDLSCFVGNLYWDGVPGTMYAGSGKSSLLLALSFCFAAPLSQLGVKSLADLRSTDATKVQDIWLEVDCPLCSTSKSCMVL